MKTTKWALFCLYSLLLLFIQGACIEINEVAQMKEDGSALLNLSIFVPDIDEKKNGKTEVKGKKPEEIAKGLSQVRVSGVKFLGEQEKKVNGLNQVSLSFDLSSLRDNAKLYQALDTLDKASTEKKEGDKTQLAFDKIFSNSPYVLRKDGSGNILITREFKPTPELLKKPAKKPSKDGQADFSDEMGDIFLNMIYINFEFFSPTEVISSNAQEQFGRNLRWKTSLGYLMKNRLRMEMKIRSSPELEKAANF